MKHLPLALFALLPLAAHAKIDLTTLPERDTVQLTIYNSADLTLAREARSLTLAEGENRLEFSWANTLIDPTSLDLLPLRHADAVTIDSLSFPPHITNSGIWNIQSERAGETPIEISYFTSGIAWRAFYRGILSPDEKTLDLEGFVRVTNNSGEDYENAQVRLVVGKLELLDEIAKLAKRQPPYGGRGYSGDPFGPVEELAAPRMMMQRGKMELAESSGTGVGDSFAPAPKEVAKEGLSEYQLYTIEGTETIPNQWSKRLPSFDVQGIPVENLYKHDPLRYGKSLVRFLSFVNDEDHKLGDNPIPGGDMRVFHALKNQPNAPLAFAGQSSFQYIPIGEDVELQLGAVDDVIVEVTLMEMKTGNLDYSSGNQHAPRGDLIGWEETNTFEVKIQNTRSIPAKVEVTRHLPSTQWELDYSGDYGTYEKIDADTIRFTQTLPAASERTFTYTVTWPMGTRVDR